MNGQCHTIRPVDRLMAWKVIFMPAVTGTPSVALVRLMKMFAFILSQFFKAECMCKQLHHFFYVKILQSGNELSKKFEIKYINLFNLDLKDEYLNDLAYAVRNDNYNNIIPNNQKIIYIRIKSKKI